MDDPILPSQVRAARALLDWSQDMLASKSKVSISTVRDFESGRRDSAPENISAIRDAFVNAGVRFVPLDEKCGPGVRLEIDVPKVKRRPTRVSFETDNLPFEVSWRGGTVFVFLPRTVLDDLDGTNHRDDAAYVASFINHEPNIVQKMARALYAGRVDQHGRLQLRSRDFFPRSE
jgi:transcriptional regulator with XRE-family HTH domain